MIDALYVGGTMLFFALMIGYVAACARLGEAADADRRPEDER